MGRGSPRRSALTLLSTSRTLPHRMLRSIASGVAYQPATIRLFQQVRQSELFPLGSGTNLFQGLTSPHTEQATPSG